MTTTSRRRENRIINHQKSTKIVLYFKLLIIVITSILLIVNLNKRLWTGSDKIVVAFNNVNGQVKVAVVDPLSSKLNIYSIPETSEVEVSRNLGVWKLGSVWKLGEQEDIGGGRLLTETLTRHLFIPTYVYGDKNTFGLLSSSPKELFKGVFFPGDTNLHFFDRVRLTYYSLSVKNTDKISIDLSESGYFVKSEISTGELGYKLSEKLPLSISDAFTNNEIQNFRQKFMIIDNSGSMQKTQMLSKYISVIGGKVISIEKDETEDYNCKVYANSEDILKYINKLFGCEGDLLNENSNFDVVLNIGKRFLE